MAGMDAKLLLQATRTNFPYGLRFWLPSSSSSSSSSSSPASFLAPAFFILLLSAHAPVSLSSSSFSHITLRRLLLRFDRCFCFFLVATQLVTAKRNWRREILHLRKLFASAAGAYRLSHLLWHLFERASEKTLIVTEKQLSGAFRSKSKLWLLRQDPRTYLPGSCVHRYSRQVSRYIPGQSVRSSFLPGE
jgi:hypothetical protein